MIISHRFHPGFFGSAFRTAMLAFASLSACGTAWAQESSGLMRVQRPTTIYGAIGQPAPSWIGVSIAREVDPSLQFLAGFGYFRITNLRIHAYEVSARAHILPYDFSPMFGAGISLLRLSGDGTLQGLKESTLLGSLMVGVDYVGPQGLRLGLGWSFHFPINLNFPFAEVGFSF